MENKKSLVALALVALVGIVGATFAYFTSSATLTNEFTTGTYSTSVTEEFVSPDNWTPGTTTKKKVNVTNNGSVEVAVRASYTEKWLASDKTTVLSGTRNGEKVAQFNVGSDWELAIDGYYYYKGTLMNGQTSSDFISSVTFNPNFILEEGTDIECTTTKVNGKTTVSCESLTTGYAGATYSLDITIETIQADQKWSYTVAGTTSTYSVGDVVTIGSEKFNVISDNGDTVTMLAQYNLSSEYRQYSSASAHDMKFSRYGGWEHTPGPKEIDIQTYSENYTAVYVNEYVDYLQGETGDSTLSGDLITMSQLKTLGCTISDDYSSSGVENCYNSPYKDWLNIDVRWWTKSAEQGYGYGVWCVGSIVDADYEKIATCDYEESQSSVRPVITISKSAI